MTKKDYSKIREAAEVICGKLDNPPSLHELGKIVSLNVNKLKYGFRRMYGTTVFSYMHSLRMRQALLILRDTDSNVTEVSERIGYSRQSSFSVAFKREFGFSPGEVKKQKNTDLE
jgi:AraC-like DNA-binding protein